MLEAAKYQAFETLRDGIRLEVRAFRPDDRGEIQDAAEHASVQSLYRRFFTVKRHFSQRETDFFFNVNFVDHVALVAVAEQGGRPVIVGSGRYVVVGPGKAEVAFGVLDKHQGKGIGGLLMRHLSAIARDAGLKQLIAEVLPENAPMLKVFEKCGLRSRTTRESDVVHVTLELG